MTIALWIIAFCLLFPILLGLMGCMTIGLMFIFLMAYDLVMSLWKTL